MANFLLWRVEDLARQLVVLQQPASLRVRKTLTKGLERRLLAIDRKVAAAALKATGCGFADRELLPTIRVEGRFVDQEAFRL